MSELVFDGQREGEKVKFVFRRHFLTARKGLLWMLVCLAIGTLPLFMWKGDRRMFWVFLVFVAVGLIGLFYSIILWYFSIYIVTDQRIRQITQKGFFKKSVVDLGLDRIQSISYGVPGILGGVFGFGTILIQTAVGDLVISMVPRPEKVYNKLQNLIK
jgi:uncharacterized membrane protein YdbT with pleckstrin-like domain